MEAWRYGASQAPETAEPEKIYSVSELNHSIRMKLDKEFPSLWIEGEISNFKHHTSGHMYFSLKDDQSQIGAVFFSRQNQSLKFDLKDGMKVLIRGRISVYEPRGQYQIYVEQVLPKGMGELQLAFLQLRERLEKEGLFDPAHKKPIPRFPKTIAVVTSPTGAAIRDILNVIHRRFHGTNILLAPVQVQGEGSAKQIAQAIHDLNQLGGVDVMIVGRGGGSLEDLWAFNEEVVARAVYASRIPVISAVGHEIDWTICDFVADLRAPTPSAAAELVVQNGEEILIWFQESSQRLKRAMDQKLARYQETLERLSTSYAFKQPQVLIENFSQQLDELFRQLQNYTKTWIASRGQRLDTEMGKLEALSPLAILRRGYSITTMDEDGALIRRASSLKIGQRIRTRLAEGIVHSEVRKVE
ncbi:MAG: exodeoxyribonuclease VII large subunit [Candidatus Omnitrophica bacterium]|nr:exodeoxyribonuclease VII large subunit [Candidatus Omnitrophota bacterium]